MRPDENGSEIEVTDRVAAPGPLKDLMDALAQMPKGAPLFLLGGASVSLRADGRLYIAHQQYNPSRGSHSSGRYNAEEGVRSLREWVLEPDGALHWGKYSSNNYLSDTYGEAMGRRKSAGDLQTPPGIELIQDLLGQVRHWLKIHKETKAAVSQTMESL